MIPDEEDEECETKPDGTRVCTKKKKTSPKFGSIKSLRCVKNERAGTYECDVRTTSKQSPEV